MARWFIAAEVGSPKPISVENSPSHNLISTWSKHGVGGSGQQTSSKKTWWE
jgi:hypothetical protein